MNANDLRHLVENVPVYVNGVPYAESHYLGHEVIIFCCSEGEIFIRTGEYIGVNSYSPAVSVGHVLDVLRETDEREIILKFKARPTFDAGEECILFRAITELVDVTGLYRSLAVHRITVDDDTLKIEVEVSV